MKRLLHIIALFLSLLLAFSTVHIIRDLPGDSSSLVEKKYTGWSGVLRAWVCSQWRCSGSFVSWLNRCAATFEKEHPGVYIEFTVADAHAVLQASSSGIRPPELLFFSPGLMPDTSLLAETFSHPNPAFRNPYLLPVCMGGYIWVINTKLCRSIPAVPVYLPDDPGRSFSNAAAGLQQGSVEITIPDPGLDLGLPVTADAGSTCTLDDFINEEIPALIISQQELARLIRLQNAGQGPEWRCMPSGNSMYADQLLLGSVIPHDDQDAAARTSLARAFLQFLLSDDCQRLLADIGAFPTTSCAVYPPSSPYAILEGMLHSLDLTVPPCFQQPASNSRTGESAALFGN